MDPIRVSIMRTKAEIPRDILIQTFMPQRYDPIRQERFYDNTLPVAIDELIRTTVIDGRVAIDANLVSGTEVMIPLQLADSIERIDPWNIIYRFGLDSTGGRRITAVYELLYGVTQGMANGNFGAFDVRASQMLQVGRDILKAAGGTTPVATAYIQLVGVNTVLVNDVNQLVGYGALRCQLTHEDNFNNLKPKYYHAFSELVVLATKAHVYNTLVIALDESMIRGGASIGRFREIVDQYADANQMYMEYLTTKWQKIATMNDTELMRKIMKISLGARPKF